MTKHKEQVFWNNIKTQIDGKEITGSYSLDRTDWMTVRMDGGGQKQTHGGPAAAGTARLILGELFRESLK